MGYGTSRCTTTTNDRPNQGSSWRIHQMQWRVACATPRGDNTHKQAQVQLLIKIPIKNHTKSTRRPCVRNVAESTGFRQNRCTCTGAGPAQEEDGQRQFTWSACTNDAPFSNRSATVLGWPFQAAIMRAVQPSCASQPTK